MWKIEGTKHLKVLIIVEREIINEYTRNRLQLNWDDSFLGGELCQAVVKTVLNY